MDLQNINETLKKYIDPLKEFWAKMTKKAKIILFAALGAVLILSVGLVIFLNRTQYVILYPNLEKSEASAVIKELVDRNVLYKESNGTISIDSSKEAAVRMELATLGYPQTSLNYDFFTNNIGVMTTENEKKIIENYQLQERLGNTLKTLEPIKNAIVTISVANNSGYAWEQDKDKNGATASVSLQLYDGKTLTSEQVGGIKKLVSTSVPNLLAENVSVTDSSGVELKEDDGPGKNVSLSEFKLQIQQKYEKILKQKVLDVLIPIYGEKNVTVSVNSIMNLDNKIKETVTYIPSGDNNTGVIVGSTEKEEQQTAIKQPGGVVGTETNSEATSTTTYENVLNGNTLYSASEKDYDYLVSQITEQIQTDTATVDDLTIAVAVNWPTMDDATRASIQELVARAASCNVNNVSFVNTNFFKEELPVTDPTDPFGGMLKWVIIAAAGGLLLALLLIIIVVAAKKKKKKKQEAALDGQMETIFGDDGSIISSTATGQTVTVEAISTLRENQTTEQEQIQKEIQEFAGENPEIAAHLIRQWLRGEES